jgi:hypothetical protein
LPALEDGCSGYRITNLTSADQTPYLPSHVKAGAVRHRTSDFTPASLERIFKGQDIVISTVAGIDYELQTCIIEAAIAADVKRFIPHEFGHDTLNKKMQSRIPGGAERAKVIQYLQETQAIEWVGIAVGCILDTTLLTGNLGFDLEWRSSTINGSGKELFPATSLERVGVVVKSVMKHWDKTKNNYIYAAGVLTSGDELVGSLERASGSEWSVGYSNVEDSIREGESRVARGFIGSGMFLLERTVIYDESLHAADPFQRRSANERLRLEPESVDTIVTKTYHEFKHRGKPGCGC